jgi:hypothetical protein
VKAAPTALSRTRRTAGDPAEARRLARVAACSARCGDEAAAAVGDVLDGALEAPRVDLVVAVLGGAVPSAGGRSPRLRDPARARLGGQPVDRAQGIAGRSLPGSAPNRGDRRAGEHQRRTRRETRPAGTTCHREHAVPTRPAHLATTHRRTARLTSPLAVGPPAKPVAPPRRTLAVTASLPRRRPCPPAAVAGGGLTAARESAGTRPVRRRRGPGPVVTRPIAASRSRLRTSVAPSRTGTCVVRRRRGMHGHRPRARKAPLAPAGSLAPLPWVGGPA